MTIIDQSIPHHIQAQFLFQMKSRRRISRKASVLTMEPSLPFGTLEEIPSRGVILSLAEIDEKLDELSMDIYAMFQLALQIKMSLGGLHHSLAQSRAYGLRLSSLVSLIFRNFGLDGHHYQRLAACLRFNNRQWKQALLQEIANQPEEYALFVYKTERNLYLGEVLASHTLIFQKISNKIGVLSQKQKAYLRSQGLVRSFERVWKMIEHIISEKEEETILKVELLRQCGRYVLLTLTFCSESQKEQILGRFMTVVKAICRLIKKFNGKINASVKHSVIEVIEKGLNQYCQFYQQDQPMKAKQARIILSILNPGNEQKEDLPVRNPDAFAIRFVQNVLSTWKKVSQASNIYEASAKPSQSVNQHSVQLAKRQRRAYLQATNKVQMKGEVYRLRRAQSACLRPSNQNYQTQPLPQSLFAQSRIEKQKPVKNKTLQRPKTSSTFHRSFPYRSVSQCTFKPKADQVMQMRLQDYTACAYNRSKVVPTLNRIQLYKADRMQGYCVRREKKLRLTG